MKSQSKVCIFEYNYVIVSYDKCKQDDNYYKMTSYNCDVNSYFLIAVDFSHKTLTYIRFSQDAMKNGCFL